MSARTGPVGAARLFFTKHERMTGLAPELRSRINSLYTVGYFVGGAVGTVVASVAWSAFGWPAVCLLGGAFALLAMLPLRGGR